MTLDECEIKAQEALSMGLISYEQLDSYAQHLFQNSNPKRTFRESETDRRRLSHDARPNQGSE